MPRHGWTLPVIWFAVCVCSGCRSTPTERQDNAPTALTAVQASALREQALELLERMVRDENAQVRSNAIEALSMIPTRLQPILPAAINDPNVGARTTALIAAGRLRACDLAPLATASIQHESEFVRTASAFMLSRCDDHRHIHMLSQVLFHGSSTATRAQAAFLLGELGDPSALPMLRQAAQQRVPRASDIENRLMHLQVAEAMLKLGDHTALGTLHAALFPARPEDLEATVLAAQILGETGSRSSRPDLQNLLAGDPNKDPRMPAEVRLAAATALVRMGEAGPPQAWKVGREYSTHADAPIRAQAAHLLGWSRPVTDVQSLRNLLDDPNPLVQVAAAAGIVRQYSGSTP
ncbi:MAG: HEAT repeat domain-containing protein [Phycisphaeraceae bacterium]|nr:HEAT repeat domain-containing protein [Phycisphaeraceae bacterium]MCW5754057.1 HEAT repeat domain-containing protein [Phycisphaeraceae bacterium]